MAYLRSFLASSLFASAISFLLSPLAFLFRVAVEVGRAFLDEYVGAAARLNSIPILVDERARARAFEDRARRHSQFSAGHFVERSFA